MGLNVISKHWLPSLWYLNCDSERGWLKFTDISELIPVKNVDRVVLCDYYEDENEGNEAPTLRSSLLTDFN